MEQSNVNRRINPNQETIQLRDRISWQNPSTGIREYGTVKWIGYSNDGQSRLFSGVQFDKKGVGTMSGKVNGQRLFYCKNKHGRIVPVDELQLEHREVSYLTHSPHLTHGPYVTSSRPSFITIPYGVSVGSVIPVPVRNCLHSSCYGPCIHHHSVAAHNVNVTMSASPSMTSPRPNQPIEHFDFDQEMARFHSMDLPRIKAGDEIVWVNDRGNDQGTVKWTGKYHNENTLKAIIDFATMKRNSIVDAKCEMVFMGFGCRANRGGLVPIDELVLIQDFFGTNPNGQHVQRNPESDFNSTVFSSPYGH